MQICRIDFPYLQLVRGPMCAHVVAFFFFQAEDGIRDVAVTGVQTCALPISSAPGRRRSCHGRAGRALGDLASIVKAYDIRGVVPDQLDEGVAEAVGAAFARVTGAATIVTMHDMRASSAPLAQAFGRGAAAPGAGRLAGGPASAALLYLPRGGLAIPPPAIP